MHRTDTFPYDTLILLDLYSKWRSRMAVKHADRNVEQVLVYFVEIFTLLTVKPNWIHVLRDLAPVLWLSIAALANRTLFY